MADLGKFGSGAGAAGGLLLGGPWGALAGGVLGKSFGNLFGKKSGSAKRDREVLQNLEYLRGLSNLEGWSPEMQEFASKNLYQREAMKRFRANQAEFYSHPGAARMLGETMGFMDESKKPLDFYGDDWQSQMRRQIMGGAQAQLKGAQEGVGRASAARGYQGAADPLARAQMGAGGASAIAQALTGLGLETEGKQFEMDQAGFARHSQGLAMLQSMLGMQPAGPYVPPEKRMSSTEKWLAGLGIAAKGVGAAAGAFL